LAGAALPAGRREAFLVEALSAADFFADAPPSLLT